ncbi:glycosyltransferase [bacterium]|nr:glycosyltransferase [bacterium]
MNKFPPVTVAIPLFFSRRFLEIVIQNIETIHYPNLHFIVSDRHGGDDTLTLLRTHFQDDPRISFVEHLDQCNWVCHYNDLVQQAKGKYFAWMPHDDSYAPDYIMRLVEFLEAHPDVILAFGEMHRITLDGTDISNHGWLEHWKSLTEDNSWSTQQAVKLHLKWTLAYGFRGLFRLQPIQEKRLYIRDTYQTIGADGLWMFGIALTGRIGYAPHCHCWKRIYNDSTHAPWREKKRQHRFRWSWLWISLLYLMNSTITLREKFLAGLTLVGWNLLQLARRPATKFAKILRRNLNAYTLHL